MISQAMNITRRTMLASPVALAAAGAAPAAGDTPQGVSLAAWSFSGSFFQGKWKLLELPGILRDQFGIAALEHVNQFFENLMLTWLQKVSMICADASILSTIQEREYVKQEGGRFHPTKLGEVVTELLLGSFKDIFNLAYTECDFVAWAKPIAEKCPDCGSPYLVEKNLKSGHFAQCPNKECKYKRELEPVPASA